MEQQYRITAGDLAVTFLQDDNGLSVSALRDKKSKKNLFGKKGSLFTAKARHLTTLAEITLSSSEDFAKTSVTRTANTTVFTLTDCKKLAGITFIITAEADDIRSRITFQTSFVSTNADWSLFECDYPALYFNADADTDFFQPYGCGEAYPSLNKDGYAFINSYPSFGASMGWLAFFNKKLGRGVYYGLHDCTPAPKKLCCLRGAKEKTFCLKAFLPLSDITRGKNSQTLAGVLVWQLYDGDWYEASQFYRDFVESNSRLMPKCDENGRTHLPKWFRETDNWFNVRVDGNEPFADYVISQAKDVGVRTSVHLYYWHKIPFDNDYPHYFPMKSVVKQEVAKLQAAGIHVMPYINGRLWDTRDKGIQDFEFTSLAKPNTTKLPNGKPFTETYSSKESDGSKVELAVMCPSTTLWQDKVEEIVLNLVKNGFDGVYIDQVAAAEAKPCTDPTHNHPAGGGSWWIDSYNTLLERIGRKIPEDFIMTTECNSDPFMKSFDGYLTWLWVRSHQVPAFPAVYSDKIVTFGTDFRAFQKEGDLKESAVRIFAAQSFLYGVQMGWMFTPLYETMPHKDFFRRLVHLRSGLHDWFNCGKMLHPPVLSSDAPDNTCWSREAVGNELTQPAVEGTLWMTNKTGKKLLLVTNASEQKAHITGSADFPDGKYVSLADAKHTVTVKNGSFETTLPGLGVFALAEK